MAEYIPTPLYEQICRVMPIACVDIVVQDKRGCVLLLQRGNEPARGRWWFPGGRVLYGERRCNAARRKVMEECGLHTDALQEMATYDVIFPPDSAPSVAHHAVTTLFRTLVARGDVVLDDQSLASAWQTPATWLASDLHPFVRQIIERIALHQSTPSGGVDSLRGRL
jgi:colanic acid biosynthesis protein WcaH